MSRRHHQFRESLEHAGLTARAANEAIAHLVPKRNVETWILCLNGKVVDEHTNYKRENVDGLIAPAAVTFLEWSRPGAEVPASCVPSLLAALPEVRRLE